MNFNKMPVLHIGTLEVEIPIVQEGWASAFPYQV